MARDLLGSSSPVLVLIHGAGHTSLVWEATQSLLQSASIAVDIPGRRNRHADIAAITIEAAAASIADDVLAATEANVVLVGHSVGGILLPSVTARLGSRVEHLVFVAGLCARDGSMVVESVRPSHAAEVAARAEEFRVRYRSHMFFPLEADDSVTTLEDPKLAMTIDSTNFLTQTVSWRGVPGSLGRTFIRCDRDRIQSPELQEKLIANCAATRVIDIDSGHTPAIEAPAQLAGILDEIVDSVPG